MKFAEHLQQELQNPDVKSAWDALEPEYQLRRSLLKARQEKSLTQADVAKAAGVPQANISRLENAALNPSLEFLKKIARGLGKTLYIEFR